MPILNVDFGLIVKDISNVYLMEDKLEFTGL